MYKLLLLVGWFLSELVLAQQPEQLALKPYTIERSQVIGVQSSVTGKQYELFIQLPPSYQHTQKKYPLLLLMDASYAFPIATSVVFRMGEVNQQLDEVIIVGVSYSRGDSRVVSRNRDYTPTFMLSESIPDVGQNQSGQSETFIKFLGQDVLPYLNDHYRIDQARKIFTGHSYGGLLGSTILVTQPALFDYYIIGSPSLDYDHKAILNLEKEFFKTKKAMPAKVKFMAGSKEPSIVTGMLEFEEILTGRRYKGLEVSSQVLKDETHLTVFPSLITQGLLWAIPSKPVTKH